MFINLRRFPPICGIAVAILCLTLPSARPAVGVGTDPTLALTGAEAVASSTGNVAVSVDGTFSFDDVVQFSFPCGLIIARGNNFVRYDLSGIVVAGTASSVGNGITAAEIPALLSQGTTAAAPAALLRLSSERLQVALPAGFGSGTASAVIYAILEGDAFVSNTIAVTIP